MKKRRLTALQKHQQGTKKIRWIIIIFILVVIVSIPASAIFGSSGIALKEVFQVYLNKLFPAKYAPIESSIHTIVWNLRLPRALLALLAGAGLSMSGCAMQAITRNVMSEPYTLGVASGASLFAAISIAFLKSYHLPFGMGVSGFAFVGAVLAMLTVFKLSLSGKSAQSSNRLILSGVAISIFCNAILQLIISVVRSEAKLRGVIYWTMGSFGAARWDNLIVPVIVCILGFFLLYAHAEPMNLLSTGHETAISLGVEVRKIQRRIVIIISIVTAVIVSASGSIGFVGLIIPHACRRIIGSDHMKLLPVATLAGGLGLIWTDALSRVIIAPEELPIGVLTSIVGVPVFLMLSQRGEKLQ